MVAPVVSSFFNVFSKSCENNKVEKRSARGLGLDDNKKPSLDLADIDVDQLFTAVHNSPLKVRGNAGEIENDGLVSAPLSDDNALGWENSQDDDLLSLHSDLSKLGRPHEARELETDSLALGETQSKLQRLLILSATGLIVVGGAYFALLPGNLDFAASLFNFGGDEYASFVDPEQLSDASTVSRESEQAIPLTSSGAAEKPQVETLQDNEVAFSEQSEAENPYLPLPNEIRQVEAPAPSFSARREAELKLGLQHRFNFQRYRTVKAIREERSTGAKALLIRALDQGKFWTRMQAVLGLAELGEPVDLIHVSKAIGNARSYLVWRYLKRFENRVLTGGELHVMRSMLKLVDSKSRIRILTILHQLGGETNSMYLLAARSDMDEAVQKWAKKLRPKTSITPELHSRYGDLVAAYKESDRAKEELLVIKSKRGEHLVEATEMDIELEDEGRFIKAVQVVNLKNTDAKD